MKSANPDPAAATMPSQAVRTAVSLVLFGHLFALAAAFLSNPTDGMASQLLIRLGNVRFLSGYTEALWMESAYDFFYTYGNNDFVIALGTDHQIEAELTLADGQTKTVQLPDVGRLPTVRYQRYKNLCNYSARMVGQQGGESIVPAAVLESLLRTHDAQTGTVRIKRRSMQTMPMVQSPDPKTRDPFDARYSRVIYTGYGQLRGGRFTYQKLEDAGESAPAGAAGSAAPATSAPPPSSGAPRTGTSGPSTAAPPPSTAAPPPSTTAPPPRRPLPRN